MSEEPDISVVVDEVFRLSAALAADGQRIAERHGLTVARWRILGRLGDEGPLSAARLARRLGFTRQTVAESTTILLRDGLVSRSADPGDRRAPLLTLTEDGAEARARIDADRIAWAERLRSRSGTIDLTGFAETAAALRAALETAGAEERDGR